MTAPAVDTGELLLHLLKVNSIRLWHDLPRSLLIGFLVTLSAIPAVIAAVIGLPILVGPGLALPLLLLTGAARYQFLVAHDRPARLRDLRSWHLPTTMTLGTGLCVTIGLLVSERPQLVIAGQCLAAVLVLLAPYVIAAGAHQDRPDLAPWRAAVMLAALRPTWLLTTVALTVVAGFVAVGSMFALAPVAVSWILLVTAGTVGHLVHAAARPADARPSIGS